ncbi:hypothetical protein ABEF95_004942 [Exophiala dermatitidis]
MSNPLQTQAVPRSSPESSPEPSPEPEPEHAIPLQQPGEAYRLAVNILQPRWSDHLLKLNVPGVLQSELFSLERRAVLEWDDNTWESLFVIEAPTFDADRDNIDVDSDPDIDISSDPDVGANNDPDIDVNSDLDIDTNSDPDIEADSDADSDTLSEKNFLLVQAVAQREERLSALEFRPDFIKLEVAISEAALARLDVTTCRQFAEAQLNPTGNGAAHLQRDRHFVEWMVLRYFMLVALRKVHSALGSKSFWKRHQYELGDLVDPALEE